MQIEMSNGWVCISNEGIVRVVQLDSISAVEMFENLGEKFFRVIMKDTTNKTFGPFSEKVALSWVVDFFNKVGNK